MPRHLHLDFETFSEQDIKDVGAYRYIFDPSAEILCAAMALDDGEPVAWWQGMPDPLHSSLDPYWDALEDPSILIYAHNAAFEMSVCQALLMKTWNISCPDLSRFRCTMSFARRACLPGSLEKLAETLGLNAKKDNRGKALLKKFSMMQSAKKPTKKNPDGVPVRRILPSDEPEAFMELVEYCRQDVRVEQEVGTQLEYFDEPINNSNYSLDARINSRGVTVNLGALRNAQAIIDEETALVSARFRDLVGFEVTQNARVLEWVNEQGVGFDNLQAETVDSFLEAHTERQDLLVVQALQMKQSIAYASIKKIATMLGCAGPHDNRIRGMLNYHGASTGRWTASLAQLQNVKRATIKTSEDAYYEVCSGVSREMLDICYGAPLEVLSSCVRHFIQDACPTCWGSGEGEMEVEGHWCCPACGGTRATDILDADYAAIEARIVAWLAGQESALAEYRAYDAAPTAEEKHALDPYRILAASIYGICVDDVNKFPQRHVGKGAKLGLGFGMGADKFRATVKKQGYDMPLGLEETAKTVFRSTNKQIVTFWYDTERAAKKAILNKGKVFEVRKIAFQCRDIAGMSFLLMRLPSGRKLSYPRARIADDRIVFFGQRQGTTQWGDVETYGGKLVENATQAVAADVMANGAHNAENAGYEIMTLIHDQALAYHKDGQTSEEFVKLLTTLPAWADGLPIAAEGSLVPFYRKE